uniref:Uncharacterized protein n=1 Tax=Solanum lycopersicum TaxID=4081 RepID=A0A3Q7H5W8_SOLLC
MSNCINIYTIVICVCSLLILSESKFLLLLLFMLLPPIRDITDVEFSRNMTLVEAA